MSGRAELPSRGGGCETKVRLRTILVWCTGGLDDTWRCPPPARPASSHHSPTRASISLAPLLRPPIPIMNAAPFVPGPLADVALLLPSKRRVCDGAIPVLLCAPFPSGAAAAASAGGGLIS